MEDETIIQLYKSKFKRKIKVQPITEKDNVDIGCEKYQSNIIEAAKEAL